MLGTLEANAKSFLYICDLLSINVLVSLESLGLVWAFDLIDKAEMNKFLIESLFCKNIILRPINNKLEYFGVISNDREGFLKEGLLQFLDEANGHIFFIQAEILVSIWPIFFRLLLNEINILQKEFLIHRSEPVDQFYDDWVHGDGNAPNVDHSTQPVILSILAQVGCEVKSSKRMKNKHNFFVLLGGQLYHLAYPIGFPLHGCSIKYLDILLSGVVTKITLSSDHCFIFETKLIVLAFHCWQTW